ncbi:MAG: tRNA uridine-5-carboxymethylaminomethyl(34) synthesis enzyme MnmG, partial [Desulfitobacteriaceae bacterium]|nr:tRNA uridine-5-carboxymethylaminomethyl(34) synthesis enzyme MnmG [Desulfitobacteriaceae bacterium]
SHPLRSGIKVEELIKRPEISLREIETLFPELQQVDSEVLEEALIDIKYEGYIEKEKIEVERFAKLEDRAIPAQFDFDRVRGLSTEGRQRLKEREPVNLGQASRITGVTPADISVLMVYLEQRQRGGAGRVSG